MIRRAQLAADTSLGGSKTPCRFSTTANDTLSGLGVRDGVTPTPGDRALVLQQTDPTQNGIYIAASGAWARAQDFDSNADIDPGLVVGVSEGTANKNTVWQLTTDAPISLGVSSITFARSDTVNHGATHNPGGSDPIATAAAVTLNADSVNAEGIANSLARSDHSHDITTGSAQGIGGANAEGVSPSLARADHNHTLKESGGQDLTLGPIADGQGLRRSGTVIIGVTPTDTDEDVRVSATDTTPGKLNDKLVTDGSISKTILNPSGNESLEIGTVFGTGAGTSAQGNDSRIPTQNENDALQGTSGAPSATNRYVTDLDVRNSDPRTPTGPAGGELGGTYPNPTVNDGADGSAIHDDIANEIANVTSKAPLAASDVFLIEDSAAANVKKSATISAIRITESQITDLAHTPLASTPPADVTKATAVTGVSTEAARADHKHDVSTASPSATIEAGDAAVEGVATSLARSDHQHAVSTAAAGTIAIGDAAVEGVATSLARSDHQHALPAPGAPVAVTKAAAAAGTATEPARADHKHDVSTAAPGVTGLGTTSGEGVATSLARSDHTHQANTAPVDVTKAAAAIGTSGEPARADHKHDVSTAAAVELTDATNAEGASTSLARADHTHAHGSRGGGSLHATATPSVAGFLSATDKTKLDAVRQKAGAVLAAVFVGNPKKATVNFAGAFADTSYSIEVSAVTNGSRSYLPNVESKAAGSFVINLGANQTVGLVQVDWFAAVHGEAG